jgi:hypothetical protein
MARPTKTQILTGEYSGDGSPWVDVAAKSGIDLDTLEFSLDGSPWYGIEDAAAVANIKKWNATAWASLKKINGTAIASVKKVNSTTV